MASSGWRRRIASAGISIGVNATILGIMAGVLASPPRPADRVIAVELSSPAPTRAAGVTQPPKPRSIVVRAAPQQPQVMPRREPPKEKPKPSILPRLSLPNLFHPLQAKVEAPRVGPAPGPRHSVERPDASASQPGNADGSSGGEHTDASSSGGSGTSAHGPGAPSAAGPGGGGGTLSGGGDGSKSVVAVADHRQEMRKGEPQPAKPETPKPRGETRSAQASRQPGPTYPSDARDEGVEGTVVLIATVGTDGRVSEVRIEKGSGDRRLDKAAEKGVKQWIYSPALKDGMAVRATVRVHVEFKLE